LAVAATLCFQDATAKLGFRILNVAIHKRPSRRSNAERDLIQGGFAPKPRVRPDFSQGWFPPQFVQTDGKPAHSVAENLFTLNSSCSAPV